MESFDASLENPNEADKALFVEFTLHPKKNEAKSAEAGRHIYDEVEYVKIVAPGQRMEETFRPAGNKDRVRFPRQYAAFKAKADQEVASGTPLSVVPWLTRSMVEELRFFNCRTVEQLAAMPDGNLGKFPEGHKFKRQAQAFLEAAAGAAPVAKMEAELAKRDNEIETLKKAMADQAKQLEELRKRGNK